MRVFDLKQSAHGRHIEASVDIHALKKQLSGLLNETGASRFELVELKLKQFEDTGD